MAYTDTANIPLHMPVPGSKEPAQIALLNENCVTLSNHDHTTGKALAIGRMRSGLAANRPAAGSAGNVYFSTDTGVFNADTGTAWVQFLTSGGQATVTGWTLVDPIVRDILSFGAKPTGTVDATITRTGAGTLRVDTNLGVGATPSAWGSPYVTAQVGVMALYGQTAAVGVGVRANSYYDGTNSRAIVTGAANDVSLVNGTFGVYTAPSVAAGAIQTFTQRLMLDQAGNLGVGATPAAWRADLSAVQVQQAAFMASGTGAYLTSNVYYDAGGTKGIVAGAGSQILLSGQIQVYTTQANAAGPGGAVTLIERLRVGNNGTTLLYPDAGQPALVAQGNVGVGVTPEAWAVSAPVVRIGARGAINGSTGGGITVRENSYYDGSERAIAAAAASYVNLTGGTVVLSTALSVAAGAVQTYTPRLTVAANGAITLGADGGVAGITFSNAVGPTISHPTNISLAPAGAIVHPQTDNTIHLGYSNVRWASLYVATAPVVGSSVELKEDITPLDPEACVASVLETDWVNYIYKPTAFVAPEPSAEIAYDETDSDKAKAEKKAKRDEAEDAARRNHARMAVETASDRRQKGYVLESPDHAVGAEFGLPDRKNRSDGADLAVVACALQAALRRLAALEGQSGPSGQQPAS